MRVNVLTEHHLVFLIFKGAAQARLSLFMSNAKLLEITFRDIFNDNTNQPWAGVVFDCIDS